MNEPAKTYYNLDGSFDWLKTIVRTVIVYTKDKIVVVTDIPTMLEIGHRETIVFIESIAAERAQDLYFRKTTYPGEEMAKNTFRGNMEK